MSSVLQRIWADDSGGNVAEYALGLAVLLVILSGMRIADVNARDLLEDVGFRLKAARP